MSYEVWGEPDDGPELPEGWLSEEDAQELRDRITALEAQLAARATADHIEPVGYVNETALMTMPEHSSIGLVAKADSYRSLPLFRSTADHRDSADAWISVDTQFPAVGQHVIAAWGSDASHMAQMKYSANEFAKTEKGRMARFEWWGRVSPWTVTHWQPMPAPRTDDAIASPRSGNV